LFQITEDKYAYLGKYNYTTLLMKHYKINSKNLFNNSYIKLINNDKSNSIDKLTDKV